MPKLNCTLESKGTMRQRTKVGSQNYSADWKRGTAASGHGRCLGLVRKVSEVNQRQEIRAVPNTVRTDLFAEFGHRISYLYS